MVSIGRSSFYYEGKGESRLNLELMRLMGLQAIYQAPKGDLGASDPHPAPYLLRGLEIDRANQVWCTDITCKAYPCYVEVGI